MTAQASHTSYYHTATALLPTYYHTTTVDLK